MSLVNKFENSVIYLIKCTDNYYYIGATRMGLNKRLTYHKQSSKNFPERKIYKHINSIGWENVTIEVLEKFPCKNKEELNIREDYYIEIAKCAEDDFCLNLNRAFMTAEELKEIHKKYREENKDKIKEYRAIYNKVFSKERCEYQKKYVEENKDKVLEKKHAYYEENKPEILGKIKEYYETHKEDIIIYKKQWTVENKEKIALQSKEYRAQNKDAIILKGKNYYENNKEAIKTKFKIYNEKNKDAIKEARKAYILEHSETIMCPCGGSYKTLNKGKHFRSKRHLKSINHKPDIPSLSEYIQ
jgi:hypothetical protein